MKKYIYILLFLLIFPASGWAAPATLSTCQASNEICFCDYSDNSSCDEGEAYWNGYATFTALLAGEDALNDDDIVDVGDGAVYRETWLPDGSGSSDHPITIRARSGESPVISGADIYSTWVQTTEEGESADYGLKETTNAGALTANYMYAYGPFTVTTGGDVTSISLYVKTN